GPSQFPEAAEARVVDRATRPRARDPGAAGDALLLRPARVRRLGPPPAATERTQAALAPARAGPGAPPIRRSFRRARRGDVPWRARAGARGDHGEACRVAVSLRAVGRLGQGAGGSHR